MTLQDMNESGSGHKFPRQADKRLDTVLGSGTLSGLDCLD